MNKRRRRRGRDIAGILLLDKPGGLTSNTALQRAKRAFDARKAGHTGNLDPLATGLLPICFGDATKVCAFLLEADKAYESEFKLGTTTNTGDSDGEVIETHPTSDYTIADIEPLLDRFRGTIQQKPPMFSALKKDGQPLYKLAHKGIEVERELREVTIHRFDVSYLRGDRLGVEVECSKGTYIRTLAEDLGAALGCGAHVSALRRTRVGPFSIADAVALADIEIPDAAGGHCDELLLPTDSALGHLPCVNLTEDSAFYVCQGQAVLVPSGPTDGLVRMYARDKEFLGVGEVLDDGRVAPRRLFRQSSE